MTASARIRRAARSDRLRGFGSGWLVSIALHAAALGAASLFVFRDSARADAQSEEIVAHIDLRLPQVPDRDLDRTPPTLPEAPPIARDVVPSFASETLFSLDGPRVGDDASASDESIERALALDAPSSASMASMSDPLVRATDFERQGGSASAVHMNRLAGSNTRPGTGASATSVGGKSGSPDGNGTGVLMPPELVTSPSPDYPATARRRGLAGDVRCRMHVDADGCVTAVDVISSSGSDVLDDAARAGLLRWRFRPATCGGVACACAVDHVVTFRLVGVHSRT